MMAKTNFLKSAIAWNKFYLTFDIFLLFYLLFILCATYTYYNS